MLPSRPPYVSRAYFALWAVAWFVMKYTLCALYRVRIRGLDKVPRHTGAMLLANHTTFQDTLICFWGLHRPSHGIGSEQVFRLPVVGGFLRAVGGIPYTKGAKDGAAIRELVAKYEEGGLVGMFPEGLRSWTGDPLPIRSGTGRLVKSLGCPVVYCRVHTGFLQHPRWATWPRLVPWEMEFDYEEFPPEATADDINAAIARGLAIDPAQIEIPAGSWGFRLAEGLPDYLWACPSCHAIEALEVPADRDCVRCRDCTRTWRVDLGCRMNGETPDTPTWTVGQARRELDRIPMDLALECAGMRVLQVKRGELNSTEIANGFGRLAKDAVEVLRGDEVVWRLPYAQMNAVLLQFRNALQIRVQDANYELVPGDQSTLRWHHFLAARTEALVG